MSKRVISLLLAIVMVVGLFSMLVQPVSAASEMKLSDEGIAYLKKEEGFCSKPYWDYAQWTIGYGSRCPDDKLEEYKENGISREDAEILLREHVASFEADVNKFIDQNSLTLTQNQFDMLVCFSYNVGSSWMFKSSGYLRHAILEGDTSSAFVRGLSLWSNAGGKILPGLVKRRMRDANMYLNGDYTTNRPSSLGYVYYDANGGYVEYKIQGFVIDEAPEPVEVAECDGHSFVGWYTEQFGGTKVTSLTKDIIGSTLYAHWDTEEGVEVDPMDPVRIKVTANEVNLREGPGTNYTIVGQANEGDILTITRTCDGTGYTWGQFDGGWICLTYTNFDAVISGEEEEPSDTTDPTEPEETIPTEPFEPSEPTEPEGTKPTEPEDTNPPETEPSEPDPTEPPTTEPSEPEENEPTEPEPTEHVHDYETNIMQPTCLNDGYTVYICECGDTYNDDITSATGHKWSEWTTVIEPTIESDGSEERSCSNCSSKETRLIDKLPEQTAPPIVEPEKPTEPSVIATGTVKVSGYLRVRSGPGTNYDEVGQLLNGDRISIYEKKTVGSMTWGKIEQGWTCLDYVVLDPEAPADSDNDKSDDDNTTDDGIPENKEEEQTTTTGTVKVSDSLRIRKGPGTTYKTVGYLKNGDKVEVFETQDVNGTDWGRIGDNKWVSLKYVEIDKVDDSEKDEPETKPEDDDKEDTSSDTQEPTSANIIGTITANDWLRIRKDAGTHNQIVGYYDGSDEVVITETKMVGETKWGKTDKGWISMDYVTESITRTIDTSCLRIRKDAGISNPTVGYLYRGTKVKITEIKTVNGVQWGKISNGWISMEYVKK